MGPRQHKALSSPHPPAGPLFLLFQPNFPHRDSGCGLPPSPLHLASPAAIRSPHCAHFTVGRTTQTDLPPAVCLGTQLRVFCLEAQALRAKRIDPGLRHWLSWEETSSEPSAVGSSQPPARPSSLSQRAWTGAGSLGSKCTGRKPLQPPRGPFRLSVVEEQRAWGTAGDREATNGALCREKQRNTLNYQRHFLISQAIQLSLASYPHANPRSPLGADHGHGEFLPSTAIRSRHGADAHSQGGQVPRPWQGSPWLPIAGKAIKRR